MKKEKKTAEERMTEFYNSSWKNIPAMAVEFVQYYSKQYGFCGEVCLTAFSAYAQVVEKLPCKNPLYKVLRKDKLALLKIVNAPQKVATQTKKIAQTVHEQNTKA